MASFRAFVLITLAGLASAENVHPESFIYSRPYAPFAPLEGLAESAPLMFRSNLNNFFNGFRPPVSVPKSAFQMCQATNNLNRERGTVQLLPGPGPRRCVFVFKIPTTTSVMVFHCSQVAVGGGAKLELTTFAGVSTPGGLPLTDGIALPLLTNEMYAIKYDGTVGSGTFTCSWFPANLG